MSTELDHESRGLDEQALDVLAASRALFAIVARSLADLDGQVTASQFRILAFLSEAGPSRIGEIAKDLRVSPSTATRSVGRVLRQGWTAKRTDLGSRRETYVELTPQGQQVVSAAMDARLREIRQILQDLTPVQRATISSGFAQFSEGAKRTR